MALLSYQSKASGRQSSVPKNQGATAQISQAQQGTQSLVSKLQQMSRVQLQQDMQTASDKAREDAFEDARNGKDFASQSVTTAYGRAYNQVGKATWSAKTEIDLASKSNQYAMDFENDPDGYRNAMKSYTDGIVEEAPLEELASTAGITGDKYLTSTYGKLKLAEHKRIQADERETFNQSWELNINQIIETTVSNKKEASATLRIKNMEYLNSMEKEGLIDRATKQKYIKDAMFKVTYGVDTRKMEGLIENGSLIDAKKFLDEKTDKNRTDMDVRENAKYSDDLTRLYNNAVKSSNAQATSLKEEANLSLSNASKVLSFGKSVSADEMNEVKELYQYASLSQQSKLDINIDAYDLLKKYNYKSLPGAEAELARLEQNPKGSNVSIEVIKQARKNLSARKSASKKDPQSQGVVEGRYNAFQAMNTSQGLEILSEELPNRINNQKLNKLEYGSYATQLFTDTEASEWSSLLEDPNTPISTKINFMEVINEVAPNERHAIFNQLRKKGAGIFTYAASMVMEDKEEVAKGIIVGQGLMKEAGSQDYIKEFEVDFQKKLGNSLLNMSEEDANALLSVAAPYALYIASSKGDMTNLKTNSNRIIRDLTNGVHKRNKSSFFLPKGIDSGDFDDKIDELTEANFETVVGITPVQALRLTQGKGTLISVGPGQYTINTPSGNLKSNQIDKSSNRRLPFILEIK